LAAATALLVATAAPASAATTVALWHMNEASGQTMVDSSGSGNAGTLENVTRVAPGFNGTGRAYQFNGTSSRVIVPNSSSLNPGASNITITAHVRFSQKPSTAVGDYDLVRKQTASARYKVEILLSGKAYCTFKGTGGTLSMARGPDLSDNRWHTIICKKTPNRIILIVDGSSFTRNGSVGSISNGISVVLGGKPTTGDWYKGMMDEVKIVIG
jgi:hypothetical protein